MNKYVEYSRKSSESEDRQVLSLESQSKEMRGIADKYHLNVPYRLNESFSAKKPGRKIFNYMVELLEQGKANSILAWHPDRLTRNAVDSGTLIYLMDRGKLVEIRTPFQAFHNTPSDKFLLNVLWGQAKMENDNKSINVQRGMRTKAEKGWYPAPAPTGYINTPGLEKGLRTISKDTLRYPLVKKMWMLLIKDRLTISEILRIVNVDWGFITTKNTPLSKSGLYKIFSNPFYCGYFYHQKLRYEGAHEKMISESQFDLAQIILGRRNRTRKQKHNFVYGDARIHCGICGFTVTGTKKTKYYKRTKRIVDYIFYRCSRKSRNVMCKDKPVTEKNIDKQIRLILKSLEIPHVFKEWALKYLNEINEKESNDRVAIFKSIQFSYNTTQKKLDNLLELKLQQLISDDEYIKKKDELVKLRNQYKEKLDDTERRANQWMKIAEDIFSLASETRELFFKGSIEEKQKLLSLIGSNFILKNRKISLELAKPFSIFQKANNSKLLQLEPQDKTTMMGQNVSKKDPSLRWLPEPRINITIDFSSIIQAFQDLRYIGELRQRWNEIKKLQISLNTTVTSYV